MLWPLELSFPAALKAGRRRFVVTLDDECVDDRDGGFAKARLDFLQLAQTFAQSHVAHAVVVRRGSAAEHQFVETLGRRRWRPSVSASGTTSPVS